MPRFSKPRNLSGIERLALFRPNFQPSETRPFAYARRKRWYSEIRGIPEITLKLTEFSPEVAESRTDGGSKNGTGNGKGIEIEANGEDNNGAGYKNKNVDIGDQFGGRPIGSSFGGGLGIEAVDVKTDDDGGGLDGLANDDDGREPDVKTDDDGGGSTATNQTSERIDQIRSIQASESRLSTSTSTVSASLTTAWRACPTSPTLSAEGMAALPFHSEVEMETASEKPRQPHTLLSDWTEEVPDYLSKDEPKPKRLTRIPKDLGSYPGFPVQGSKSKEDFEDEVHRYWKAFLNRKRKNRVQKRKRDGSIPKRGPAPKRPDNRKTPQGGKNVRRPQGGAAPKGQSSKGLAPKGKTAKDPAHAGHKRGPQTHKGNPDGRAKRGGVSYAKAAAANIPCPHALYVMGEGGTQAPIIKEEFYNIAAYMSAEWTQLPVEERVKIKVRDSKWQNGRGVFLCEDEVTKKWVKTKVGLALSHETHACYRAFGRDELRSEQATVRLSPGQVLTKGGCEKVLQSAFEGLQLGSPGRYMLQDRFRLKDGGILCKLMLDMSLTRAIKARDGRVSAGPTGYLCFQFKNLNLEEARASTEGSPAKATTNTEVITGNDPGTHGQAQAEVNEVQME